MPIFNRERKKGPVRDILLPKTTSLRPKDIFDAKFTYDQAMKEEGNPESFEPSQPDLGYMPHIAPKPSETTAEACIPCTKAHISTTSSALSEAMRFARTGGIKHPEVKDRIGIALDEINICERIDLAPNKVAVLKGKEKEVANWILEKARELRHSITEIKDIDSLEKAVVGAAQVRNEFFGKAWDLLEE